MHPIRGGHGRAARRNRHITPHIAWATREARARLMAAAVDNVRRFIDGQPRNRVR